MQKNNFKLGASISFVTAFEMPSKFWIFGGMKILRFDTPTVSEKDWTSKGSIGNTEVIDFNLDFFDSAAGRAYLAAYFAALHNLKPDAQSRFMAKEMQHFFSYNILLEIENRASHAKPIMIRGYEMQHYTRELMATARKLKQLDGKTIVLNADEVEVECEDEDDSFMSLAEFWSANVDVMELHYCDYETEEDAEVDKVYTAFIDSKSFALQFNRIAHEIDDLFKKFCVALGVTPSDIGNYS
jgi:hypothetical protein